MIINPQIKSGGGGLSATIEAISNTQVFCTDGVKSYTPKIVGSSYFFERLPFGTYTLLNADVSQTVVVDAIAKMTILLDVSNVIPAMTSNTTPYGEASANASTAYPAWRAVDGNTTTEVACGTMGQALDFKYHFANEVLLVGAEFYALKRGKKYTIETSMDGVNWDVQVTVNDPDIARAEDAEMTYTFQFNRIVRCRYIRVLMTYFQNYTGNPAQFRELKAMGVNV